MVLCYCLKSRCLYLYFLGKQYSIQDKIVGCGTGLSGNRIWAAPFIVCLVWGILLTLWFFLSAWSSTYLTGFLELSNFKLMHVKNLEQCPTQSKYWLLLLFLICLQYFIIHKGRKHEKQLCSQTDDLLVTISKN